MISNTLRQYIVINILWLELVVILQGRYKLYYTLLRHCAERIEVIVICINAVFHYRIIFYIS